MKEGEGNISCHNVYIEDTPPAIYISIGNLNSSPVIASSGVGKVEHFSEVFEKTKPKAALASSIFHREEVPTEAVKTHMRKRAIETRLIAKVSVQTYKALPDDLGGAFYLLQKKGLID